MVRPARTAVSVFTGGHVRRGGLEGASFLFVEEAPSDDGGVAQREKLANSLMVPARG